MLEFTLHKIAMLLVIVGALNWGLTGLNFNLVKVISDMLFSLFNYRLENIIYLLVGFSAIYLLFKKGKNLFKPFLDQVAIAPSVLNKTPPTNAKLIIRLQVKPSSKVVYWASLPNKDKSNVWEAYDDYSNAGVVNADKDGVAFLKLHQPSSYYIPSGKLLPPHVHYRECCIKKGIMGALKTIYI